MKGQAERLPFHVIVEAYMDFTELVITVAAADAEAAAAICHMAVPYGLYIEDYSDLEAGVAEVAGATVIDEQLLGKDPTRAILHLYISPLEHPLEALGFLKERLESAAIPYDASVGAVREEDWANNWKQYFKPVEIGQTLAVCPTWETYENHQNRHVLQLDPGSAFGTGTHATTRLTLVMLEGGVTPGARVLDIGCGSGILSIAAGLLGAREVLGVDIDPMAVKVAEENTALNNVEGISFAAGDLADAAGANYDIIVANIVADVILRLIPEVPSLLSAGGRFIASGIIGDRVAEVQASLAAHGFTLLDRQDDEGWSALICTK